LDQLFTNAITIAHENSQKPNFYSNYATSPAFEYSFDQSYNQEKEKRIAANVRMMASVHQDVLPSQAKSNAVLGQCTIYVSRKLVKQQTELGNIAQSLGAEFLWTYDDSCTHFIYAGKLTDTNKELKVAREQGKVILNASWLYECKEKGEMVDVSAYLLGGMSGPVAGKEIERTAEIFEKKTPDDIDETEDHEMNEVGLFLKE